MSDPYEWHVSSVRAGDGSNRAAGFVHYVQRYISRADVRYTGEVMLQSHIRESDAQGVADAMNADPARPYSARLTYL